MGYFLLRNDALFVGPAAALNVCAAVKVARKLGPGHNVVTILCDGGDRYISKVSFGGRLLLERLLTFVADVQQRMAGRTQPCSETQRS